MKQKHNYYLLNEEQKGRITNNTDKLFYRISKVHDLFMSLVDYAKANGAFDNDASKRRDFILDMMSAINGYAMEANTITETLYMARHSVDVDIPVNA